MNKHVMLCLTLLGTFASPLLAREGRDLARDMVRAAAETRSSCSKCCSSCNNCSKCCGCRTPEFVEGETKCGCGKTKEAETRSSCSKCCNKCDKCSSSCNKCCGCH